jgi:hypothetical protein
MTSGANSFTIVIRAFFSGANKARRALLLGLTLKPPAESGNIAAIALDQTAK